MSEVIDSASSINDEPLIETQQASSLLEHISTPESSLTPEYAPTPEPNLPNIIPKQPVSFSAFTHDIADASKRGITNVGNKFQPLTDKMAKASTSVKEGWSTAWSKRNIIAIIIGSIAYLIIMIIVLIGLNDPNHAWHQGCVIFLDVMFSLSMGVVFSYTGWVIYKLISDRKKTASITPI